MDVPSTAAGVVKAVAVKKGDRVSKGSVIVQIGSAAQRSAGCSSQQAPLHAERAAQAGEARQRRAATAPAEAPAPEAEAAQYALRTDGGSSTRRQPPAASAARSTKPASRARMRARPCASSRASSAWISAASKAAASKGRITPDDVKALGQAGACSAARLLRRRRAAESAGSRFREVRPDRGQAARPHPEDFRSAPAGELAQCSARLADG